ncbi:unnamed protein product [Adineta steineri]|uniref:PABC domain-containing protein n=1 Tax=Adineta steineri TaxID=433720 RepID=A0A819AJH1_9BILA|nr:unnamed protein product [Adineta steineri]CAF3788700.1 unnamed protein product [Adineta steineri]
MATNNIVQNDNDNNYTSIKDDLDFDDHVIFTAINEWERHSIGKIQLAAQQARNDLHGLLDKKRRDFANLLIQMNENITADINITKLTEDVYKLRQDLSKMSSSIHLEHDKKKFPIYLIKLNSKNNDQTQEDLVDENINVPGTTPLTVSMLYKISPVEQKQILGERLFILVQQIEPKFAAKITGMFLELDIKYILILIQSHQVLKDKIKEALNVLQVHQYRQRNVIKS